MIKSKKELSFFIMADRIMNGYPPHKSILETLSNHLLCKPPVIEYLSYMRKLSFYKRQSGILNRLRTFFYRRNCNRLSTLMGVFIYEDSCDYGLVVPHHGTLRIGSGNKIGRYAVVHTVVNMTASNCEAGDGLYLSIGCKVNGPLKLGNNVTVGANTVVNKSFGDNVLLAGIPAAVKKENYIPWYIRDGERFKQRVEKVEALRIEMGF